ncbi:OadG family transporter subunit [Roseospira goensis]|uniref:Na+-transporting methylmalonyl-CoA/oxaloacetate decarboxylase gamma subunit n=1 Tax=Roseospira goensis TaxID=391922 RepID=A0A7W6WJW0_9PROT|nr:Na+-transporting methylmalonyl-CoA/oxaloacetate decarboxylase gamma subunit [Roseospira goensis]
MFAGLDILVIGIIVVLAVLSLLWAACAAMGFAFRTVTARQQAAEARRAAEQARVAAAAPPAPAPAATPPPGTAGGGIPAHHLAVIAAATAAAIDGPHRITRVWMPVSPATDWANQARLQGFSSHRLQGGWSRPVPALTQARTASSGR